MSSIEGLEWLVGGGELGRLIRNKDWSATPLGPRQDWPEHLKTTVSLCLSTCMPSVIWWGRKRTTQVYNDVYATSLGGAKRALELGLCGRESSQAIARTIRSMCDAVFELGEPTVSEHGLHVLDRTLPREECYFSFCLSPIRGVQGEVDGIWCTGQESTVAVLRGRRLETLHELAEQRASAHSLRDACDLALAVLLRNPRDVPFARAYLVDGNGNLPSNIVAVDAANVALRTGQPADATGLELPGGKWPEVATRAVVLPLFGPDRGPMGVLVLGVSPRRPLDAEYRDYFGLVAEHVSNAVTGARERGEARQRAEALTENERLVESDRRKDDFLATLGHELRNPLAAIGYAAEMIKHLAPEDRRLQKVHQLLERQSRQMVRVVDGVLEATRIAHGKTRLDRETVDAGSVVRGVLEDRLFQVEGRGLRLVQDLPTRPVWISADPVRIAQVVDNLLGNAIKFTQPGGSIWVSLRERHPYALLRIRDNGRGMSPDTLERLFEPFEQGGQRSEGGGLGLGLALAKGFTDLHGGTIDAHSDGPDRGTELRVRLPLTTAPAEAIAQQSAQCRSGDPLADSGELDGRS